MKIRVEWDTFFSCSLTKNLSVIIALYKKEEEVNTNKDPINNLKPIELSLDT